MSEQTPDIEILPPDQLEVEVNRSRRSGPGYPMFLGGLILASLLGALGGGAAAYYLRQPAADVTPIQQDVSKLKSQIVALERTKSQTAQALKSRPDFSSELSDIEARVIALETAPAPEFDMPDIPDIDPEALVELKAAQEAGFEWPDTAELEADIAALQARFDEPNSGSDEIAALQSRIETLEAEMAQRSDPLVVVQAEPITTDIPPTPFPKAAILAALDTQTEQGGFLDRTLSKHIRVKDNNDPLVLIEAIESALERGDNRTAREKFDRLPSSARAAGQAWRDSVN